jgi:hypothetical protein
MRRRPWLWFGGGLIVFAGFGVWAWFLAGRTLEVADQWSSVLSSFAALVGLVVSVMALVGSRTGGSPKPAGTRNVHVGGDASGSTFVTGDGNSISR